MSLRIDPKKGLTDAEIFQAERRFKHLEEFPSACCSQGCGDEANICNLVVRNCDLVIRHQVNYGESLYLRGECSEPITFQVLPTNATNFKSLNWNKGIELQNIGSDKWTIPAQLTLNNTTKVAFKFLINDRTWEEGETNHGMQDLIFLTQKNAAESELRHAEEVRRRLAASQNPHNAPVFRVDPKRGLTNDEIFTSRERANRLKTIEDPAEKFYCNLVVRYQVKPGENLYLRGESSHTWEYKNDINWSIMTGVTHVSAGANGLNWQRGAALRNISPDTWTIPVAFIASKTAQFAFKFLINDSQWEEGANHDMQDFLFLIEKSFAQETRARQEYQHSEAESMEQMRRFAKAASATVNLFEQFFGRTNFEFEFPGFHSSPNPNLNNNIRNQQSSGRSSQVPPTPAPTQNNREITIKNELGVILGNQITSKESLNSAFKAWSRRNHPDRAPEERRAEATATFQRAVNLRDELIQLMRW